MNGLRNAGWALVGTVASLGCAATTTGVDAGTNGGSTGEAGSSGGSGGRGSSGGAASTGSGGSGGRGSSGGAASTGGGSAGSHTIAWNGGNFYLYGINYPWLTYGCDFGSGGFGHLANPSQVAADMATFAGQGGHFLRWWVWVDGRYDPLFDSNGQVTGFDSLFFSDLDTELQSAADNHVYLASKPKFRASIEIEV
ncbi:MAG: hypothetical protein ACYDCL_21640 [Myxococcales bacterium]